MRSVTLPVCLSVCLHFFHQKKKGKKGKKKKEKDLTAGRRVYKHVYMHIDSL